MTLPEHIARSLFVAYRFMIGDATALKFMEVSGRSVLRSFSALIFAAPIYILTQWLRFRGPDFEWTDFLLIFGLFAGYAFAWVMFAYAIFYAWLVIGPRHNYLVFMPLYNWGRIYFLIIMLPYFALGSFSVIAGTSAAIVWWVSLALGLSYKFYITRKALGANVFHGILFVLFDVLLVLFVEALFIQAFGLPGIPL
jgi:hypothetical protein